jgi:hypothetical protein
MRKGKHGPRPPCLSGGARGGVASQLNLSHLKAMDKSAAQDCFASYESVDDGVVKHGGVGKEPKKLALFFINFPFSFSRKKKIIPFLLRRHCLSRVRCLQMWLIQYMRSV